MIENSAVMDETQLTTDFTTPADREVERVQRKRRKGLKNLVKRDGIWYFTKFVNGKREFNGRKTPFSLDTKDEAVAKAKRDAILKAAGGAEIDRVLGRSSKPVASIAEVLEAYIAGDRPREETRKKNAQRLRLILKRAGISRDLKDVPVSDLTREVVECYQNNEVERIREAGGGDESEEMIQANS